METESLMMDGMFCKVMLTGRQVDNIVKVPLTSLNPDSTVYLARGNRLKIPKEKPRLMWG